MKTRLLMKKLYRLFPREIAKKYHDYVGVRVSPLPEETKKIVLCLDLDDGAIQEVYRQNPDMVITHHPFLYGPSIAQTLKEDLLRAEWTKELVRRKISVVSFHTNFDAGNGGMNDVLAKYLNLENISIPVQEKMMRIGTLPFEMSVEEFSSYAKEKLKVSYAMLTNYGKKNIRKVAIIGGGGAGYFRIAQENDADIFLSGDAPHHIRRDIANAHYNYLEVPHEVERVFMPRMKEILLKMDEKLDIVILDHEKEPKII